LSGTPGSIHCAIRICGRHTAIEQKLQLARKSKFQTGVPAVYDFTLHIPDQGYWSIRAALSRRLRKDFTVEQEIFVYNGPAPN